MDIFRSKLQHKTEMKDIKGEPRSALSGVK